MISEQMKTELCAGDVSTDAVGRRLKLVREALGLTQARMSALMNASIKNYQHMERGSTYPRPAHIKSMYEGSRIDFNFIYYGDHTRLPLEVYDAMEAYLAERSA